MIFRHLEKKEIQFPGSQAKGEGSHVVWRDEGLLDLHLSPLLLLKLLE